MLDDQLKAYAEALDTQTDNYIAHNTAAAKVIQAATGDAIHF